jgi:hypothetical protein
METYRKTYYDTNFNITIYVNNKKGWESTRLTIKKGNGWGNREVYRDFKHVYTIITNIYGCMVEVGVRGNTIREIIKDITNKIIYKD